jgi:hypothetical protein
MEKEIRYVKKRFSFLVDQPSKSYSKRFELDKTIRVVNGLLMSSNKPHLLFYRGSQKIDISGEEIFPEDYESRLLMSGISVPPNQKFADLGDNVLAGNGEVKILYKDFENTSAAFEPYEVSIYMLCELS